jgi:hypothetical protein
MKFIAALLALALSGSQGSAQFGLRCTVTYPPPPAEETSIAIISIDLDRGVWCWVTDGACPRGVKPIIRADATTLVLNPTVTIDRINGNYREQFGSGTCVRTDFTPIPEAAF